MKDPEPTQKVAPKPASKAAPQPAQTAHAGRRAEYFRAEYFSAHRQCNLLEQQIANKKADAEMRVANEKKVLEKEMMAKLAKREGEINRQLAEATDQDLKSLIEAKEYRAVIFEQSKTVQKEARQSFCEHLTDLVMEKMDPVLVTLKKAFPNEWTVLTHEMQKVKLDELKLGKGALPDADKVQECYNRFDELATSPLQPVVAWLKDLEFFCEKSVTLEYTYNITPPYLTHLLLSGAQDLFVLKGSSVKEAKSRCSTITVYGQDGLTTTNPYRPNECITTLDGSKNIVLQQLLLVFLKDSLNEDPCNEDFILEHMRITQEIQGVIIAHSAVCSSVYKVFCEEQRVFEEVQVKARTQLEAEAIVDKKEIKEEEEFELVEIADNLDRDLFKRFMPSPRLAPSPPSPPAKASCVGSRKKTKKFIQQKHATGVCFAWPKGSSPKDYDGSYGFLILGEGGCICTSSTRSDIVIVDPTQLALCTKSLAPHAQSADAPPAQAQKSDVADDAANDNEGNAAPAPASPLPPAQQADGSTPTEDSGIEEENSTNDSTVSHNLTGGALSRGDSSLIALITNGLKDLEFPEEEIQKILGMLLATIKGDDQISIEFEHEENGAMPGELEVAPRVIVLDTTRLIEAPFQVTQTNNDPNRFIEESVSQKVVEGLLIGGEALFGMDIGGSAT